jgi:hypothetical protein
MTATSTFSTDLRARLSRAEARMDRSESDAEFEANRQIVIYLRALLEERGRFVQ